MKPLVLFLMAALSAPAFAQAPEARPQLFIAPSGEPFRAGADEAYPVAKWFAGADANGDGKLVPAEFMADGERWFTSLDSSRNEVLEASEIDAYEAAVLAPLTRRPGMGGAPAGAPAGAGPPPGGRSKGGAGMPRGAGLYGLINIPHPVKAADQDMNSRVTLAEYRKVMASRFEMLDRAAGEVRAKAKTGSPLPTGELVLAELPKTAWQQMRGETTTKRR